MTSTAVSEGSLKLKVGFFSGADDRILDGLVEGSSRVEVFEAIAELFAWRENGSQVGFCWHERGSLQSWSTGVPPALTGVEAPRGSLWDRCRTECQPVELFDLSLLSEGQRRLAEEHGLTSLWVHPVADPTSGTPTLVSVWSSNPEAPPRSHTFGMLTAARYVELAQRWFQRVHELGRAANHDELTGLPNRRAFFQAIEAGDASSPRGAAVLYCDLDGFKLVNDAYGHATGDTVLRVVADRLRTQVREGDLVARLGGDEFAIVLWATSSAEAEEVADRLRESFDDPIELQIGSLAVGISVGSAFGADGVCEGLVEQADHALYEQKRERDRPA